MLTDPLSVTYAAVVKTLPRTGMTPDGNGSTYRLNDGTATYTVTISHTYGKRNRYVVRLVRDMYVADPLVPANSIPASATCTLTMDGPNTGVLPADLQALAKALVGFASDATVLKIVNGET